MGCYGFREKALICIYCLIKFPTHHEALKHYEEKHTCPICPELSFSEWWRKEHEQMTIEEYY